MNTEEAVVILKLLLDGVDPETGEIFEKGHVCLNPQVMRALHTAIIELTAPKATALQTNASFPVTQSGRLNAGRPWTDADDEELEQLYHAAAPMDEICRRTQRRKRGVANRLAYLGLEPPPAPPPGGENVGQHWSVDEERLLAAMLDENKTISEIAHFLKRRPNGVRMRMVKLGLLPPDEPGPPVWTEKSTAELRQCVAEGMSLEQMAEKFGRTVPAIQTRLFYMGIAKDLPFSLVPKHD